MIKYDYLCIDVWWEEYIQNLPTRKGEYHDKVTTHIAMFGKSNNAIFFKFQPVVRIYYWKSKLNPNGLIKVGDYYNLQRLSLYKYG